MVRSLHSMPGPGRDIKNGEEERRGEERGGEGRGASPPSLGPVGQTDRAAGLGVESPCLWAPFT